MRFSKFSCSMRWDSRRWYVILFFVCATPQCLQAQIDLTPNREAGFNELVIMDPGTHQDGLPAVIYDDETQQIDVPPSIHTHRYYYSGDKEYQGPIINGGPTVVVANHPKTNERMYVDVMLPPGAPEIAYTRKSIQYIYPDKRVVIEFSYLLPKHVKVAILPGRGIRRTMGKRFRSFGDKTKGRLRQSSLVGSLKETVVIPKNVAKGAFGVTQQAAVFVVGKAGEVSNLIPGVAALRSLGEQSETFGAQEEIRQAGFEKAENASKFLPTIR